MMVGNNSFQPPWYLRSGQIQTVLASMPLRAWGKNPVCDVAEEITIQTPHGIRLQGYHSSQGSEHTRGLVILLHGWEGSADSTYIACTGRALYQRGYDIFRLNFRDHGSSHHLNPGIFYAVLLEEVFQAVVQISRIMEEKPVFLVGFSLGGNFALRIARQVRHAPIKNLGHVVAISPVLDPEKATVRIDRQAMIRKYFLKKWLQSLQIKQGLFPEAYDFSEVCKLDTIMAVTEKMIEQYSDYDSASDYFKEYSILYDAIDDLSVQTTIVTAADDPIIPVDDFYELKLNQRTELIIHSHGGHNGFIDGFFLKSWYEQKLASWFDEIACNLR
ncbi:MAG: alpha/beta fold hydrolase [Desulfobacteraceae bacterium]|jgi:predicted alpha/beta-fold hydrolase|nr:alpha/beta fold hydrolase [Desulfobacteraceae bacterium]